MRRPRCLALAFVGVATLTAGAQQPLTVEQVVATMREAARATPTATTVDTIKAGDPSTVVTGIATTVTPTMDVLRRAVAARDNLIITHEPTFYNHPDAELFKADPVYLEKQAYIRDHGLVIFRWHDGFHAQTPDFTFEAWKRIAGWTTAARDGRGPLLYTSAPVTVKALARQLQSKLRGRVVRVVGDPDLTVTKLAYTPGAPGEARQVTLLERDDVEVLVGGEIPEWETIAYALDAAQQGRHKAMILVGHYTSEEPGMEDCAIWLKTVFPGMRVDFIAAGEPYWAPARPPATKRK